MRENVPEEQEFNLLLRKGNFPYEWIKSIKNLDETSLP